MVGVSFSSVQGCQVGQMIALPAKTSTHSSTSRQKSNTIAALATVSGVIPHAAAPFLPDRLKI
jgi:hypothetical protein